MKEANKNNYMKANIKYIRIFVIIILVCFTFGLSYALLTASYTSNKNHIITVGSLKLTLDDSASSGITLSNALPESDTNGLKEQDYTFTLTNTGTATFVYNLNLVDNTLDSGLTRTPDNSVKYYLTKDATNIGPSLLNTLTTTTDSATNLKTRNLDNGILKSGEKHTYSLKVWIGIDATAEDASDTHFSAHMEVKGTQYVSKNIEDYLTISSDGVVSLNSNKTLKDYFYVTGLGYINQDVVIPSKINGIEVKSLSSGLFESNTYITGLTLPYTLVSIGGKACYDCYNMTSLTIENTDAHRSRLETIGASAFGGAAYTRPGPTGGFLYGELKIPASVKTVGDTAFAYSRLSSIVFEDSVEHPSQLQSIERAAFGGVGDDKYNYLTNVVLPNTAFTFVNIPFADHTKLTSITFNGTKDEWNAVSTRSSIVKGRVSVLTTVHCSDGDLTI